MTCACTAMFMLAWSSKLPGNTASACRERAACDARRAQRDARRATRAHRAGTFNGRRRESEDDERAVQLVSAGRERLTYTTVTLEWSSRPIVCAMSSLEALRAGEVGDADGALSRGVVARARGRAVAWSLVVAVARSRGNTRALARALNGAPLTHGS